MEHVPGPVDDRLEQLVPGPRGRRQPGDLVQEAQLLELVGGARAPARRRSRRWRARRTDAERTLVMGITIQA